ncbi:tyrosine-type recombinase/integrase [Nitrobacter sp.]|uniref:tyrosine-type recombinase/integrase n=1 Tax=Nitrobacter sp. TaxID=29420 RepID=UPI003F649332
MTERLIPRAQRGANTFLQFEAYCRWALDERGFTPATVQQSRWHLTCFLTWCAARGHGVKDITIDDVDAYIVAQSRRRWCRRTINSVAKILRMFFRFLTEQGWLRCDLSIAIQAPRIYAMEDLPTGVDWQDVGRLFSSLKGNVSKDIRDRAILMLMAVYGLRSSEVAGLQLEHRDWDRELLRVRRVKRRGPQDYPMIASFNDALLAYLKRVRQRPSVHREVFLSLAPPYRPMSTQALYDMVSKRLHSLGVRTAHYGPHSLRHACATRLVAEGLSLKEIGDHLGHRSTRSTRIYAKVDLTGLREVAAFDLGELP